MLFPTGVLLIGLLVVTQFEGTTAATSMTKAATD